MLYIHFADAQRESKVFVQWGDKASAALCAQLQCGRCLTCAYHSSKGLAIDHPNVGIVCLLSN